MVGNMVHQIWEFHHWMGHARIEPWVLPALNTRVQLYCAPNPIRRHHKEDIQWFGYKQVEWSLIVITAIYYQPIHNISSRK